MKHLIQSNKAFYYEDLVSEEILLFSAPDNFEFTNELIEKFFDFIDIEHRIYNSCIQVKYNKNWYDQSTARILSIDNEERKNFISWLEQFDVKLLNYQIIE
jgi:hypothetical protein